MTAAELIQDFSDERIPLKKLMQDVRNKPKIMGPIFVDLVTRLSYQSLRDIKQQDMQALIPVLFLLSEWRNPYAYRPVAHLLRRPTQIVHHLVKDHATETSFRILASLFEGDLSPLTEGACDPGADDFVRGSFIDALVLTSLAHPDERGTIERFFRHFCRLCPEAPEEVMINWMGAIIDLGMQDMSEAVHNAMRKEFIPSNYIDFADFEAKLQETIDGNGVPSSGRYRKFLISDSVGELF